MKIRLWKLGSLEHKLMPTKETVERLANILFNTSEVKDIIWGPDISVQEIEVSGDDLNVIVSAKENGLVIEKIILKPKCGE